MNDSQTILLSDLCNVGTFYGEPAFVWCKDKETSEAYAKHLMKQEQERIDNIHKAIKYDVATELKLFKETP